MKRTNKSKKLSTKSEQENPDMDALSALDLPADFFKQFKDKASFQTFFQSLFKQGIESMLEAEMEEHLGYKKHSSRGYNSGNSRNGYSKKKMKSNSVGDILGEHKKPWGI